MNSTDFEVTPDLAALKRVIQLCGGSRAELLRRLRAQGRKCSDGLIYAWENRDLRVSHDYVLAVSEAVEWAVSPHELRRAMYPHPEDGLPLDMRGKFLVIEGSNDPASLQSVSAAQLALELPAVAS